MIYVNNLIYEVERHPEVIKAFEYTKKEIPSKIGLLDLKEVCDINKNDLLIPIQYQYLWYCLNGVKLTRKKGRVIFNPKVSFYPIYVENDSEVIKLIKICINKIGSKNFAKLVNRSLSRVTDWKNGKRKPPLTAILKACQIFKKDPWKFLENKKLFSQSKSEDNYLIFRDYDSIDLNEILIWIKNEGTISLNGSPRIEIEQHMDGINCLQNLKEKFENVFGLSKNKVKFYSRKNKDHYVIRISSAPLRQILCLKYDVPLGYKCPYITSIREVNNYKNREEGLQILASLLETEGSFTYGIIDEKMHLVVNFTSASYNNVVSVISLLKKLNYIPYGPFKKETCFRLEIRGLNQIIKLAFEIMPYCYHKTKIMNFITNIIKNFPISRLRMSQNLILPLKWEAQKKFHVTTKRLTKILQRETKIPSYCWEHVLYKVKNRPSRPTLEMIFKLCKFLKKNWKDYLPSWTSFLLYIHNYISYKELVKLRKMEFKTLCEVFETVRN